MIDARILTVKQPWADLTARGIKGVENRYWSTAYRGPVLIHAGVAFDIYATRYDHVRAAYGMRQVIRRTPGLTYGAVLAVVDLVDVHKAKDGCCQPWGEHPVGERPIYHLVWSNVRRLPDPVAAVGRLGMVRPGPTLLRQVLRSLDQSVHLDGSEQGVDPVRVDGAVAARGEHG